MSCKWELCDSVVMVRQSCKPRKGEWTCKLLYASGHARSWAVKWTLEDTWACPKMKTKLDDKKNLNNIQDKY